MKSDTINTLEFWEKVKEEYVPESVFLCFSDVKIGAFQQQWKQSREEIKLLGNKFIKERGIKPFVVKKESCFLFKTARKHSLFTSQGDKITIRIDFIDWNIERLKK